MPLSLAGLSDTDVEAALESANEHRRAGRDDEAEPIYQAVRDVRPTDPRAAYGLGLVRLRKKDLAGALPLLAFAAETEGAEAGAWRAYFQGLLMAGEFEAAERLLVLRSAPEPPAANLELPLRQHWGMTLQAGGALAQAEAQLTRAVEIVPEDADAHADLGVVQLQQRRHDAAEKTLRRVLEIAPDHLGALVNLGSALKALNRLDEAEASYRKALAIDPDHAAALGNLAVVLNGGERYAEGLECADRALAGARPSATLVARGAALYGLGRYEEALQSQLEAVATAQDPYEALTWTGITRAALGQYEPGLAALDDAVARRPQDPMGLVRRAAIRLMTGDFAGGWQDNEARWRSEAFLASSAQQTPAALRPHFAHDAAREDLAGRRVLLVSEQGIGDQVMFASMIGDLAGIAREVVCVCEPRLVGLFSRSFDGVSFLPNNDARISTSAFDAILPMGSLGRLFRNRLEDFPGAPFLRVSGEAGARWSEKLGPPPVNSSRIGLSWRGGTARTRTSERSLALQDVLRMIDAPGARFVSLQYGDPRAEVEAANAALGMDVEIFPPEEIADFDDLAGLIANLDVVVSVQNTAVHLTGALGRPCFALIPQNPEWRYMARSPTMPWYGSVRLFRQPARGAWAPVLRQVSEALKAQPRS